MVDTEVTVKLIVLVIGGMKHKRLPVTLCPADASAGVVAVLSIVVRLPDEIIAVVETELMVTEGAIGRNSQQ